MNKKILASIFVIGILALAMGYGTYSFFSDTEKSTGNVFTAGTIDIAVNGWNPWEGSKEHFELNDMKPCETGYIVFNIQNVGTNPVNVWKHLTVTKTDGGIEVYPKETPVASSEPEYKEGLVDGKYIEKCDIDTVITYDLSVEVYNAEGAKIWWQVIIPPEAEIKVSDVECHEIPLGMIPVGGYMIVTQSYHMQADVTNWAQGDKMTFDIEIYAEQLNGELMPGLFLVPKYQAGPSGEEGRWIIAWDKVFAGTYGELKYNTKGPTFDYTFKASGLAAGTGYSLIYYADPWPGNHPGALIATFTTDGSGNIASTSGSVELNMDLPALGDANYPGGAKIWLVPSSDYPFETKLVWNPEDYLFEFSLIKYDDIDVP